MARLPRLYLPDTPVHAIVRGNDRQAIFRSDGDRIFFHRCMVENSRRFEVRVHAYVFMTNHVHLLATGARPDSLSRLMQTVGRRYVGYFNYLHRRTGTLWEGRYKSSLVECDRYFLACQRYIEMNPVRAGMVSGPDSFPWSSFAHHTQGRPDDLVTPHALVLALGKGKETRRCAYEALFDTELPLATIVAIRDAVNKGWALGDDDFCKRVETLTGRRASRGKAGRPKSRRKQAGEPARELA